LLLPLLALFFVTTSGEEEQRMSSKVKREVVFPSLHGFMDEDDMPQPMTQCYQKARGFA